MAEHDWPHDSFLKGVGLSVWQNSPDEASQWTTFAKKSKMGGIVPNVMGWHTTERYPDFWNRYEEDIRNARETVGCTAFRFSFEWSRIEPEPGRIDQEALQKYHKMLDAMENNKLIPFATLWHFTHPEWFERRGAFTKDVNVAAFVQYCRVVFREFGHRIRMWATFNEPTINIVFGYIYGIHPPGGYMQLKQAGMALKNVLRAHAIVHRVLKALPHGREARIGLVHFHLRSKPRCKAFLHVKLFADWMDHWIGWRTVPDFFKTGKFVWRHPLLGTLIHHEEVEMPGLDWWGINYYTEAVIDWNMTPAVLPGEKLTDMGYKMCAPGLYRTIKHASELGVPMYITETGVADRDDKIRAEFIYGYMSQVMRAVSEGCDVRGFFYWTLVDNFEWNVGYKMKFGLYQWETDGSVDRKLRRGSLALVQLYRTLPDSLGELRQVSREMVDLQPPVDMVLLQRPRSGAAAKRQEGQGRRQAQLQLQQKQKRKQQEKGKQREAQRCEVLAQANSAAIAALPELGRPPSRVSAEARERAKADCATWGMLRWLKTDNEQPLVWMVGV